MFRIWWVPDTTLEFSFDASMAAILAVLAVPSDGKSPEVR